MADGTGRGLSEDALRRARASNLIDYLMGLGLEPAGPIRGTRAMFRSPLREDKHASFSVTEKDGVWVWYDFGTGAHGDGIAFVMAYHGVSFQEAVERLSGERLEPLSRRMPTAPPVADRSDQDKIKEVQTLYRKLRLRQTPEDAAAIEAYFARYAMPVHPGVQGVILTWNGIRYLGIPLPNLRRLRGLECRAIDPETSEAKRRITLGKKTLWVMKRESGILLITESVMDSLAGDHLYPDWKFTLVALNGIANVEKVTGLVTQLTPRKVYLALDNDADQTKGPAAEQRAAELLTAQGVPVHYIRAHHKYGVKDLGALWRHLQTIPQNQEASA